MIAIAYDPRCHPLILRYALTPVLATMKKQWSEGAAVVVAGIRLLSQIAAREVGRHRAMQVETRHMCACCHLVPAPGVPEALFSVYTDRH